MRALSAGCGDWNRRVRARALQKVRNSVGSFPNCGFFAMPQRNSEIFPPRPSPVPLRAGAAEGMAQHSTEPTERSTAWRRHAPAEW